MSPNMEELYQPARFRTHRIVVEETTFYLNGHFLAEISSFFASAFFGDFKETESGIIDLKEELLEDFRSFLEVILPQYGAPITADNFALVVYYADMWDIDFLRRKCRRFLEFDIQSIWLPVEKAVDLLEVALMFDYKKNTTNLVSYIASFDTRTLQELDFEERIEDKQIVETIFRLPSTQHRGTHRFNQSIFNKKEKIENKILSACCLYGCNSLPISECRNCCLQFCELHEDAVKCLRPEKIYSNTVTSDDTRNQVKVIPYRTNYINIEKLIGE